MIAVIADDLTGAAEMGGLGWRHGLAAEILHRAAPPTDAQLLVYDADSRNCSPAEARRRVRRILRHLQPQRPDWIFKKVDSVLRGNVLAEIETALKTLGLNRCVLVPANPAAGRVIRAGHYFIHGQPLHETDFRNDPRHPRLSSQVTELIGTSTSLFPAVLSPKATLPDQGLIVGEADSVGDVRHWAGQLDETTLAAGGAEFFRSLLSRHGHQERLETNQPTPKPGGRTLFVCGSLSETANNFMEQCRLHRWPVLLMPDELLSAGSHQSQFQQRWAGQIITALQTHPKVVMGIGRPSLRGAGVPQRLGNLLTGTAQLVLAGVRLDFMGVEGGATAALLTEKLGWQRLGIEREFATGVVGMKSPEHPGLVLVVKPGSYAWPAWLLE